MRTTMHKPAATPNFQRYDNSLIQAIACRVRIVCNTVLIICVAEKFEAQFAVY
jgi:hypothetical protein